MESVLPKYRKAFKNPHGSSVLHILSHRHEHIQRNEVYLHSFFNYAINIIFGNLHAPVALLPGKNPLDNSLCESGRCSLFFICQYILACVLLLAEVLSVLAKLHRISKYPFRRQTVESNALRCSFHFKDEFSCRLINSRLVQ
jgi:hypothetical protein